MKYFLAALLLASAFGSSACAQGLEVTNRAFVQVISTDAEGNEQIDYQPAQRVLPGDVIRYVVSVTNNTDQTVAGVTLNSEIPSDLLIQEGSAESDLTVVQYSADGGASYADRANVWVTQEDGTRRPAQATDLTNVMWTLLEDIEAGESQTLSYFATVR